MATRAGKKLKCSVDHCGKEYNSRTGLSLNVRSIHLGIKFDCNFCSKKFKFKGCRDSHIMSVHTKEKGFKCRECLAKFATAKILHAHRFVHSEERPHKCLTCSKQFKQKGALTNHIKAVHTTDRRKDFECSICLSRFFQKSHLTMHSLTHGQEENEFGCYFCKKRFNQRSDVETHTRIHTQEKPFFCTVESCQYSCSQVGNLKKHAKRNHSPLEGRPQSRTWTCYFCSSTLSSFTILVNHLRLHTLEEPFSCGLCQKRFKSQINLRNHIFSHTTEKPWSCKECPKCFVTSSNLKKQIRGVHRMKRHYFCQFCSFSSYTKSDLTRHNLKHGVNAI